MIFKNQVERNEFYFNKIVEETNTPLQTMWIVENLISGERHVIVTNSNGEYRSDRYPHSRNTNANDKFLSFIDQGHQVSLEPYADNMGIGECVLDSGLWFGIGEDNTASTVDDALHSLPHGHYRLSEVRTNTNEGLELCQDILFNVTQDFSIEPGESNHGYKLGTLKNNGVRLTSVALNEETGNHTGTADGRTVVITDTVNYDGLRVTGDYVLYGVLMDADTVQPILDGEGQEITSVTEVTLSTSRGTITGQSFELSTDGLEGVRVVVYEYLYTKEDWEARD
jgi:hypothetical protein